jgi:hypothetical protein
VARVTSNNTPNPGAAKANSLTLQCSNPFVPTSIQDLCAANGITSFKYGVSNAVLPKFINVNPVRQQYRFVAGAKGKIPFLGSDLHYDAYVEHGENITDITVSNITLNARYNAAIQAVRLDDGTIACAIRPRAPAAACRSSSAAPPPARRRLPISPLPMARTSTPARPRTWPASPSTTSRFPPGPARYRWPSAANGATNSTA